MLQRKEILISAFLVVLLFGFGIGYVIKYEEQPKEIQQTQSLTKQTAKPPSLIEQRASFADVAESAISSVVNISSEKIIETRQISPFGPFQNDPFFRQYFGNQFQQQSPTHKRREQSLGSGVVISKDGVILTNNHVIEKANKITVSFVDGRESEAKILGTDPDSDLAVLQLKTKMTNLKPIKLGDSSLLRLGEVVLAIGNPFGVGQTVTMGIVSAKGRANVGIVEYEDFIQTDAAINPGNSGGALVNMKGELIGINTAIVSRSGGYQGIGFAIPSNMAEPIMESLLKEGKVVRGWLGVGIQNINQELAQALSLKNIHGVLVTEVMDGSPAKEGGLRQGDVILTLNGKATVNTSKLRNLVANTGANQKANLTITRDGKEKTLTIKLGEKPREEISQKSNESKGSLGGLHLSNLNNKLRNQFGIPKRAKGVIVLQVEPNSQGESYGFKKGDLILQVNNKAVQNTLQLKKAFSAIQNKAIVLIKRRGRNLFMVMPKMN